MTTTALQPIEGLTVKETAHVLGVAPQTVYGWIAKGKIKCFRVGGSVRINEEVIEAISNGDIA